MRIAILGGGVSGLMVGRLLKERGHEIEIFELEAKLGGLCRSDVVNGFVYDIAGGHIFHSRRKDLMDFIVGVLGDQAVRNVRNTKIYHHGHYVKYPFENGLGDLPLDVRYECLMSYIEAHYRRQYERLEAPQDFRNWCYYRFGKGITEQFMLPYNEKIWNIDPSKLGSGWIAGRVPDAPIEDVVKAALGIATEGYQHQAIFYYPRQGGFQTFVDKLAEGAADRVHLSTAVKSVRKTVSGWEVNGRSFDDAMNCMPLHELLPVLEGVPRAVHEAAERLMWNSVATVLIGLEGDAPRPYSWLYLPHPENGRCNRITYLSNYSTENAPPGCISVLAEVTYPGRSDLRVDDSFVRDVVNSLDANGMLDKRKVCTTASRKLKYAYAVYDLGSEKRIATIMDYFEQIGLSSVGRFARFSYINVDHAIGEAMAFVEKRFPARR